MRPIISTRELAEAINVSESSLKRWADDGIINVSKTAGGHRRIAIGEAIRFIRSTKAPLVRPDVLGLSDLSPGGEHLTSPDDPSDRLFAHLFEGRAREVRGLLLSLYLAGQSVAQISDGPIRSAMTRLGELWKHDVAGVFLEHRATDICIQAIQLLRQFVEPQDRRFVALGGAAPGDPYVIPSLLCATAMAAEGWQSINLGPDTPIESIQVATERHAPKLVWLSISSMRDARELEKSLGQLAETLKSRDVAFVVGGRAGETLPVESMPLRFARSIAELVTIAGELTGPTDAIAK